MGKTGLPCLSFLGNKEGRAYFGNLLSVVGEEGFLLFLSAGVELEALGSEETVDIMWNADFYKYIQGETGKTKE